VARGRMLNRKVSDSYKVAQYGHEYGPWAIVFHHRLISWLDKNGNCHADPYWLKSNVMLRIHAVTPEDCRRFTLGLVKYRLAVLYEEENMPYLHFPGFREEQVGLRPDRENAEHPVPQGFDEESGTMPERFRKPSGYDPERIRNESADKPSEEEVEVEEVQNPVLDLPEEPTEPEQHEPARNVDKSRTGGDNRRARRAENGTQPDLVDQQGRFRKAIRGTNLEHDDRIPKIEAFVVNDLGRFPAGFGQTLLELGVDEVNAVVVDLRDEERFQQAGHDERWRRFTARMREAMSSKQERAGPG